MSEIPPLGQAGALAPIYGLVLGGGRSRRMGVDKATLNYQGKPQLEIVFDMLAPFSKKHFVGIRPDQAELPGYRGFPALFDVFPGEGPLGAVVSAQKQFPDAAWLVVAAGWSSACRAASRRT